MIVRNFKYLVAISLIVVLVGNHGLAVYTYWKIADTTIVYYII